MQKYWQINPVAPPEFFSSLPEIEPVIAQILWNRGLRSATVARAFLSDALEPELSLDLTGNKDLVFYNPFLFRDMQAAVDIIVKHIKARNKIVVYGDYDADGVTAAVVLSEALKTLQAMVDVYLPDRVSEGYGLNKSALDQIKEQGVSLVITVDNGIRNKDEVDYAHRLGLEVIITDHHVLPENRSDLPACPVIDPADAEDKYPWPFLAGVGVAFKLVCALLYQATLPAKQKFLIAERSLDLVAVGTIADMVSLLGENRFLVKRGLSILNQNRRLGLKALFQTAKIALDRPLEEWNVGWQLGPRLNAASRLGHANSAFALISAEDEVEARNLAQELNQRNLNRQQITEEIIKQMEAQIDKDNLPPLIIGVAQDGQSWNEGIVGLIAGKICDKYHRPTLVVARIIEEEERNQADTGLKAAQLSFKGSGRSIEGFNLIAAIEECSEFLDKYGGHPMACGFSIENVENLNGFRDKLLVIAKKKLTPEILVPKLSLDAALSAREITLSLADSLTKLAPFGQNNPQPKFTSANLRVDDIVWMGKDRQHIKLRLAAANSQDIFSVGAIAFNAPDTFKDLQIGDIIDLAYYLEINEFNGRRELQLKIIDWRKSTD
ncbi:MAG TPA: single-stranded-DNA-specific exonuclease RecJ [bacterium]|mgnify:FL=1|jgi:single-stranded-DNA-specific exonuclease|nr:MAG: Single-stranded-DNA-specific exonuclease RecJ [Parcubacteria group bacterium ADurb.Bin115]HOD86865.1 single-stranded-DNA-specific exonuclease RecJ [bacterium]HQL34394.1 single-stranded-DNA-specific exonuclease RecJ [bacterium]